MGNVGQSMEWMPGEDFKTAQGLTGFIRHRTSWNQSQKRCSVDALLVPVPEALANTHHQCCAMLHWCNSVQCRATKKERLMQYTNLSLTIPVSRWTIPCRLPLGRACVRFAQRCKDNACGFLSCATVNKFFSTRSHRHFINSFAATHVNRSKKNFLPKILSGDTEQFLFNINTTKNP